MNQQKTKRPRRAVEGYATILCPLCGNILQAHITNSEVNYATANCKGCKTRHEWKQQYDDNGKKIGHPRFPPVWVGSPNGDEPKPVDETPNVIPERKEEAKAETESTLGFDYRRYFTV